MNEIRVLAILEATTVTGPAKNLLRFAALTKNPPPGGRPIQLSIATFSRGDGGNAFLDRARESGIETHVLRETSALDRRVIGGLQKLVEASNPHIVQTHAVKSHFLARVAGLNKRARWIAFHHGYTSVDAKMAVYNQLDRWSLRAARQVITVCRPFAEELAGKGVAREKIKVLPNSIEAARAVSAAELEAARARYGIRAEDRVILSIGRFSREKGHIELVAAAAELARSHPKFKMLLAGEGPERAAVAERAAVFGDRFTLAGQVSDVRPLFGIAEVFVLPSYSEGSPNVLLEAMAAGVPIVATNVGGVPETVDESTALLTPPRDAPALASAIARLFDHPELAARLRENALQASARRSPEEYYRALAAIYGAVAEPDSGKASG